MSTVMDKPSGIVVSDTRRPVFLKRSEGIPQEGGISPEAVADVQRIVQDFVSKNADEPPAGFLLARRPSQKGFSEAASHQRMLFLAALKLLEMAEIPFVVVGVQEGSKATVKKQYAPTQKANFEQRVRNLSMESFPAGEDW